MKITVIGCGYVGLVTGLCLSEKGHHVICVDKDKDKIKKINSKISPIYEKGLKKILLKNINVNFFANTDLKAAIMISDFTFICVGTPFNGSMINLDYVKEAAKEIGKILKNKKKYHTILVKSTVVPGTTDDVILPILEKYSNKVCGEDFGLGVNPEFLREGSAILDFMNPDRIVIGSNNKQTHKNTLKIYRCFKKIDFLNTNNKTAEMIKYTSNSFLATLISFSNEIANFCYSINDVDILQVMKGCNLDRRISPILDNGKRIKPGLISYMEAGIGFGGSCFPKDVKAIINYGKRYKHNFDILRSVIKVNKSQPFEIIKILKLHYPKIINLNITLLGLSFKPHTSDMRESPSIPIIKKLLKYDSIIKVYDPIATVEAKKIFKNMKIKYCDSLSISVKDSDVVIILTSWPEFKKVPKILKSLNLNPLLIDGRRMISKNSVKRYAGIGYKLK